MPSRIIASPLWSPVIKSYRCGCQRGPQAPIGLPISPFGSARLTTAEELEREASRLEKIGFRTLLGHLQSAVIVLSWQRQVGRIYGIVLVQAVHLDG